MDWLFKAKIVAGRVNDYCLAQEKADVFIG